MMLMIPQGYEKAAPGTMPDAKAVAAMMKYNEALKEAGVLLTLDGLHPPSMGARVQVKSKDEAVEWASRCPASGNEVIEIRQVQEFADFPADVQKAAGGFSELQAKPGQRKAR
jgi:hypothetical protein